jgi:hypothetical protein
MTILRSASAAIVALTLMLSAGVNARQRPGLDTEALLAASAKYMDQYERDVSAIVAEEEYLQQSGYRQQRRLRSDFLVIRHEEFGWIEFRDVFLVDGIPIRDRQERLASLFMKPREDAVLQARRIAEEGARYNLGPITRTINTPLVALRFLATRARDRSTFHVDAAKPRSRDGAVALRFTETAHPRMVMTPDDKAAEGTFWIEPASGRVMASELHLATSGSKVDIRVTFAKEPRLQLWLPARMDERYDTGRGSEITGWARYTNFRQFRVETTTDIGKQ